MGLGWRFPPTGQACVVWTSPLAPEESVLRVFFSSLPRSGAKERQEERWEWKLSVVQHQKQSDPSFPPPKDFKKGGDLVRKMDLATRIYRPLTMLLIFHTSKNEGFFYSQDNKGILLTCQNIFSSGSTLILFLVIRIINKSDVNNIYPERDTVSNRILQCAKCWLRLLWCFFYSLIIFTVVFNIISKWLEMIGAA